MTNRVKGFVVTLSEDIREDDADGIASAIRMLRGVLDVTPSIVDHEDHMNRERIRRELQEKLWGILRT